VEEGHDSTEAARAAVDVMGGYLQSLDPYASSKKVHAQAQHLLSKAVLNKATSYYTAKLPAAVSRMQKGFAPVIPEKPGNESDEEGLGLAPMMESSGEENEDEPSVSKLGNANFDTTIQKDYQQYAKYAENNFIDFTRAEVSCIRLQSLLIKKKAPLDAHGMILEWRNTTVSRPAEKIETISRNVLLKRLVKRYNLANKLPKKKNSIYHIPRQLLTLFIMILRHNCNHY